MVTATNYTVIIGKLGGKNRDYLLFWHICTPVRYPYGSSGEIEEDAIQLEKLDEKYAKVGL